MTRLIVLDSGILGMITNPKSKSIDVENCKMWYVSLLQQGEIFILPEIADYELRRELIRGNKQNGLKRLDELKKRLIYLPITTEAMLLAAQYWAEVRKLGSATADIKALDADVILAAQATLQEIESNQVIVATTNVKHLSLFVDAREWNMI